MKNALVWFGGLAVILTIVGIVLADDYAIAMDETTMHQLALHTHDFLVGETEWTQNPAYRYHGPLVEYSILVIQKALSADTMPSMVTIRHLVVFSLFIVGVIATGLITFSLTRSQVIGLYASVALVLSPRIFGEAFVNSRDIPFLSLYALSMLFAVYAHTRNKKLFLVVCAVSSAAATATRIMGVFIPIIVVLFSIAQARRKNVSIKHTLTDILLYGIVYILCTYAFWPLLWESPLAHTYEALTFPQSFSAHSMWYVPYWILVTTPLLYIVLFFCGLFFVIRNWNTKYIVPVTWLVVPLAAMLLSGSGIYNGWRHVYFLYPAVLVIGAIGLHALLNTLSRNILPGKVLLGACVVYMATVCMWMVDNHPLEYVYFNSIQRNTPEELDYWGISTRSALDAIAKKDERPLLGIYATNRIAFYNAYAFYPERMFFEAESDAASQYIIDTTPAQDYATILPKSDRITQIQVGAFTVATVYKGPRYSTVSQTSEEETRRSISERDRPPWTYGAWIR